MAKSNKPYKTSRTAPKCVKYWDKVFKNKGYYFDWQVMRTLVESKVTEIKQELEITSKEARVVAWNAYCAAAEGEDDSPLWKDYQEFSREVEGKDLPEFVYHVTVGMDIHGGWTEKQSKTAFIEWLKEDYDNGDFGEYRMTTQLKVVKA